MALWGTISPPTLLLPSLSSFFHAVVPSVLCLNVSASSDSLLTLCSLRCFSVSFASSSLCVCCCMTFFLSAHSVPLFPPRRSQLSLSLSSLSLSLTAFLSLFFLIRVTRHCCTDCANVTTQSDITDNNKLFPKIPSDTVVRLLRSPINLSTCGYSVCSLCDFLCIYVCVSVTGRQRFLSNGGSSQFTGQKKAL